MSAAEQLPITIAGAGSVGCYVGARLAAAGRNVTLLTRPALADRIARYGLVCSDLDGDNTAIPPERLKVSVSPAQALADAKIVLVTVKSHDSDAMAALIAEHASSEAVAISLQNGVANANILRRHLAPDRVIDAMVPFNVVQHRPSDAAPRVHRATGGAILVGKSAGWLRSVLNVPHMPVIEHENIEAVLWGKLLVNLNNGLNALSGLPIVEQLGDRHWRTLVSRQLSEGLAVLKAAGIRYAPYEGVPQRLLALAMRLPDALFRAAARRMLSMDKSARSSMWEDLQAGRPTEIDYLQGEIIRLSEKVQLPAPLNRRVRDLVMDAERAQQGSPQLSPEAVWGPL